jgi:Lrp/AsnC family transcriptional regulator, leucine-responsive regulatory protein
VAAQPSGGRGEAADALDAADRAIVDALCADARMSFTDLGRVAGLSTSAVHQRVRRLEERGVIRGYTARVDPEAVGLPLTAFIAITPISPADPDDLPERLAPLRAVVSCYSVAGDANYLLQVRVATPRDLEALVSEIRSVAHVTTRTTVVLSTPFEDR